MSKTTRTQDPQGKKTRTRSIEVDYEDFDLERDTEEVPETIKKIQAKHLFLTYFIKDETKDKQDILDFWGDLTEKIDSFILCKELCPTTQRIHWHLLITSTERFKINGIKRLVIPGFQHPNVRFVENKQINNVITYCSKQDPSPLYKKYKPMKVKFNLNQDLFEFIEKISPMLDGKKINDQTIKEVAKKLNIGSHTNYMRFQNMVKTHISNKNNEHYVVGGISSKTKVNIPTIIEKWMQHEAENKAALIIRTPFPESAYEMLKSFGPHILHKGSVDMMSFDPDINTLDAKFLVFKTVATFQGNRDSVSEHSSYITNLFEAMGSFNYGHHLLHSSLPLVYIEDSKRSGSVWETHNAWIGSCNLIEIVNFDKDIYREIINDKSFLASVNDDNADFDAILRADDIDDYVIVRHLHSFFKTAYDLSLDDSCRANVKPKELTKYNFTKADMYYGTVVDVFDPQSYYEYFLQPTNKRHLVKLIEYFDQGDMEKFLRMYISKPFEEARYRSFAFLTSNNMFGAVKGDKGWELRQDMTEIVFKVANNIYGVVNKFYKQYNKSMSESQMENTLMISNYKGTSFKLLHDIMASVFRTEWANL
jgi:hypothetical protein